LFQDLNIAEFAPILRSRYFTLCGFGVEIGGGKREILFQDLDMVGFLVWFRAGAARLRSRYFTLRGFWVGCGMDGDIVRIPEDCPFLPRVAGDFPARVLRGIDARANPRDFVEAALRCAQAKWRAGLPGQAVLMLNRVFGLSDAPFGAADDETTPYRAMFWVLRCGADNGYLGNPRRHFQHLATRMPQVPGRERRVWRAWACWHLARLANPDWEADAEQLLAEGVFEPGEESIQRGLVDWGLPGEAGLWGDVVAGGGCGI